MDWCLEIKIGEDTPMSRRKAITRRVERLFYKTESTKLMRVMVQDETEIVLTSRLTAFIDAMQAVYPRFEIEATEV
jgi:hypothetical protein